jgi:hypothetical protein
LAALKTAAMARCTTGGLSAQGPLLTVKRLAGMDLVAGSEFQLCCRSSDYLHRFYADDAHLKWET